MAPRNILVSALVALLALPAGAAARERNEAAAERVVEPGESLWRIARDTGCSVERLREANDLDEDAVLQIGARLKVPGCDQAGPSQAARYTVASGDTLSRIARKHDTTVDRIRSMNDLDDSMIRVGQTLRVPGEPQSVAVVAGQSLGRPHRGRLHDPARLKPGRGYHLRRPDRTFAARHVVDHTRVALSMVRQQHPRLHSIAIGDLSLRQGGWISGHKSHQSGRDVDVGLCFKKRPRAYPNEFVVGDADNLDLDATWTLIRAFADTENDRGGVERIFLDFELQGLVYRHARRKGVSRRELDRIFQYPHGRWAREGVVRHLRAHDDHLHVRFRCPEGDDTCE